MVILAIVWSHYVISLVFVHVWFGLSTRSAWDLSFVVIY